MKLVVLKLNRRYDIEGGAVIPRSHFNDMEGEEVAVIQIDIASPESVVSVKKVLSRKGLKKLLGFKKNVEVEIE